MGNGTFWPNMLSACVCFMLFTVCVTAFLTAAWRIFVKAGRPGWLVMVPVANVITAYRIAYGSAWRCLWLLVPVAGIVSLLRMDLRLADAYGRDPSFGLGLFFLNPVFVCIMGFSRRIRYEEELPEGVEVEYDLPKPTEDDFGF